jgi:hypothetical protein
MHILTTACALLLLAAWPAHAQDGDPLKSPACGAALERLQSARAASSAPAAVEALRSEAANTCLGMGSAPSRPSRTIQAPIVVPPPRIDLLPTVPRVAVPSAPPPPLAIERPPTPATCDAGGCWTNDGTHMRQVPPNLIGPRGLCTQQGGVLYCP